MIFVTIGSMFPFDRLIRVMDEWCAKNGRDDVFAQIGNGTYIPKHMKYTRRLSQAEFGETVRTSQMVVAHAGMGTVITAGGAGRPLVLLPRIQAWGEHTTDHQIATANWLKDKTGIFVAYTDEELPQMIETAANVNTESQQLLSPVASPDFTDKIRSAILGL